jgi:hypothetical protein
VRKGVAAIDGWPAVSLNSGGFFSFFSRDRIIGPILPLVESGKFRHRRVMIVLEGRVLSDEISDIAGGCHIAEGRGSDRLYHGPEGRDASLQGARPFAAQMPGQRPLDRTAEVSGRRPRQQSDPMNPFHSTRMNVALRRAHTSDAATANDLRCLGTGVSDVNCKETDRDRDAAHI